MRLHLENEESSETNSNSVKRLAKLAGSRWTEIEKCLAGYLYVVRFRARGSGPTINAGLKEEIPYSAIYWSRCSRFSFTSISANSSISFNYFITLTNVLLIHCITRVCARLAKSTSHSTRQTERTIRYYEVSHLGKEDGGKRSYPTSAAGAQVWVKYKFSSFSM